MIFGDQSAFTSTIHRFAAQLKASVGLLCGVFSPDPKCSAEPVRVICLPKRYCYANSNQMLMTEVELSDSERMTFAVITTPKKLDFAVAKTTRVCEIPLLTTRLIRG